MTWKVLQRLVFCIGIVLGISDAYAQNGELEQMKQFALQKMRISQSAKAAYDQCLSQYGTGARECSGLAAQWNTAANNYGFAYFRYQDAKKAAEQSAPMSSETGNKTGSRSQDSGRYGIISGDWVSDCSERNGGVFCHRFGGFVTNTYPPGCEGNAAFFCKGMSLCELASIVPIIATDIGNGVRLAPGVASCSGHKRPLTRRAN